MKLILAIGAFFFLLYYFYPIVRSVTQKGILLLQRAELKVKYIMFTRSSLHFKAWLLSIHSYHF